MFGKIQSLQIMSWGSLKTQRQNIISWIELQKDKFNIKKYYLKSVS